MITAVMGFSTPMDMERLKATIEHRLLGRYDRFRQRAVETMLPIGAPHWEDYPAFDINEHIHSISLPPPADQAALQDVVSDLMSTQLDFDKPLWEVHVIENYGEGSALVTRLHHCIADGIALMQVLLSLTDTDPDAPWPTSEMERERRGRNPLATLFRPARSAIKLTTKVTGTLVNEGLETLSNPSRRPARRD